MDGQRCNVPVPLHPLRQLSRGFNQADDLAVRFGLPVWRVLRRTRRGTSQALLPAEARTHNVRGAFVYQPSRLHAGPHPPLAGSIVVLIDDVMTTGATAEACGRALLKGGASEVRVLTVAKAVAPLLPAPRSPPRLSTARR